ncbi:MAG: nucleotidyl transferase AbiEii/AbiGii toxin family protein, partial [Candidatus Micrarchaeia archaeon]
IPLYDDIPPYSVFSMDEREIAAEKIRAIMTRGFARDLYDLWYISKKGIQIDKNLVERKLFEVGMKFSMKEFKKKVSECKREWEKELSIIVPAFPKFTSMQKEIFGFLPQDLKHHP